GGQELKLEGETPVQAGSFTAGADWKEVSFSKTVEGRYLCLEALNSQQPGDPLSTVAELELTGADGRALPTTKWQVVYASSEEVTSANHSADKLYDLQESTFWQSQSVGAKPQHPHQVVIDLGEVRSIRGFRYLPRSDKRSEGMLKDYKLYFKTSPFKF
ncbi:discoidin domain-containing protein, partial [Paraflavisolibacter sp. H34]|uniref:discoidin domain-containing protein n=1 Tax=Huijunlia imazamoxiresistens TaxID=3127457 RepID=UPI003019B090